MRGLHTGYVGFHPPRPHQLEEVLTESNVKSGLVLAPAVPVGQQFASWSQHVPIIIPQAETYSAQDSIRKRLIQENALGELEEFMNQVFTRKAESVAPVP